MIYYIMLPNDNEFELTDSNILGEISFGKFKRNDGFTVLTNIVDKHPELLTTVKILDQTGKKYTIDEFLSVVEQH